MCPNIRWDGRKNFRWETPVSVSLTQQRPAVCVVSGGGDSNRKQLQPASVRAGAARPHLSPTRPVHTLVSTPAIHLAISAGNGRGATSRLTGRAPVRVATNSHRATPTRGWEAPRDISGGRRAGAEPRITTSASASASGATRPSMAVARVPLAARGRARPPRVGCRSGPTERAARRRMGGSRCAGAGITTDHAGGWASLRVAAAIDPGVCVRARGRGWEGRDSLYRAWQWHIRIGKAAACCTNKKNTRSVSPTTPCLISFSKIVIPNPCCSTLSCRHAL